MSAAKSFDPMTVEDLKVASEARAKRRAEFARLIEEAGMDPSQLDVTKIMNDEEQAAVIAHMASIRRAKELAETLGRDGLRERLKQTFERAIRPEACE